MERLLELRDSDIFPDTQDKDPTDFKEREAVRAVVTDNIGQVALIWVEKFNHHELPGGGVKEEDGGDLERALNRETLEEVGSRVGVVAAIGTIIEYEAQIGKKRISHGYLAEQLGAIGEPELTQKEIDDGQELRWAKDIGAAIRTISADQPKDYVGQFIRVRELAFLRAAALLLRS